MGLRRKRNWHLHDARNVLEPARTDLVRAFFILLHLLERYPERPGKVGLVQIEHQASHADAIPDVHVSSMW